MRLEQRTKNLKALLERAASDGYTAFATVVHGSHPGLLEIKPLASGGSLAAGVPRAKVFYLL